MVTRMKKQQKRNPQEKVIIMGAAGRDFHDFLTYFKDNKDYKVVCFTAEQIPGIAGRKFPAKLAGKQYPKGIPIYKESHLSQLIKNTKIEINEIYRTVRDVPDGNGHLPSQLIQIY